MSNMIVGRNAERKVLLDALKSTEPEMVAVIGRRRVGKTYLIRAVFEGLIDFELVGMQGGLKEEQLQNFAFSLRQAMQTEKAPQKPSSWLDAFQQLVLFLEGRKQPDRKTVVFLDELPWLATHRSGFLSALSYFWNSWASRNNIVVVICGSAASWMINKIINNKGGLHNRVTRRIFLYPFSLSETEEYLTSRNILLDHYQITLLYMVMGGIPHYLKEVRAGQSAIQNIQEICFSTTGILRDEFDKLYHALFDHADNHITTIKILAAKTTGLTHSEIVNQGSLTSGGRMTTVLSELIQSGFVQSYEPFNNKKKDTLYRLTDEYSLFYLKFIQSSTSNINWQELSQTQSWKSWSGYAFEGVCLKHAEKIKEALKIAGIYSTVSSFKYHGRADNKGAQIDLVIDRADQTVNLCEVKFYNQEIELTKSIAENLRHKRNVFQRVTKSRKQLFITLISTYGLKQNIQSIGLIDQSLTLEDLF